MGYFLNFICKKSESNSFKAEKKKKPKQIQYFKSHWAFFVSFQEKRNSQIKDMTLLDCGHFYWNP